MIYHLLCHAPTTCIRVRLRSVRVERGQKPQERYLWEVFMQEPSLVATMSIRTPHDAYECSVTHDPVDTVAGNTRDKSWLRSSRRNEVDEVC